jgi:hypothetical protein
MNVSASRLHTSEDRFKCSLHINRDISKPNLSIGNNWSFLTAAWHGPDDVIRISLEDVILDVGRVSLQSSVLRLLHRTSPYSRLDSNLSTPGN